MTAWITLTTDYGTADGFHAVLRGVIARIAPDARVIDVTHEVPPGDVRRGAAVLAEVLPHMPTGVHVVVVDPGVGTARRAVALATRSGDVLVGPDNGVLIDAAGALGGIARAVELTNPAWFLPEVTATFHGRDLFAPAAAHLALGAPLGDGGPGLDPAGLVRLPAPVVDHHARALAAEVVAVDHFGNVRLAATGADLAGLAGDLVVGGHPARRATTFADVPEGALAVLADSSGHAALAVNRGSAAGLLGVAPGDVVRIAAA